MTKRARLIALLTLTTVLNGCVIAVGDTEAFSNEDDQWRKQARENKRGIDQLSIGQSIQSVIDQMGPPDINEAFLRDGETYKVYYYRTHRVHADNRTTKDEATPLLFVGGELVGWGDAALKHAAVN